MRRVGYLVSDLRAPSHTFVRREIAALEAMGFDIDSYSIHGDVTVSGRNVVLGHSPARYFCSVLAETVASPIRTLATWALSLRHRPAGLKHLLWSQFHFVEALFLARTLRHRKVQHVHNHFANSGATVGLLAANQLAVPWSLTLHGISETDFPAIATLREKLLRASFVACASRFMMAQGMRLIDHDEWSKFSLVRCGIDRAFLPESVRKEEDGLVKLACVGRLSAEKGYFGLFEALSKLPTDCPPFNLRIVGDGPMKEKLIADVSAKGLGNQIEFLGALSEHETLKEIAECSFLVLPSLMEGLPVVLIEAHALGKPVIASNVAGIPELVRHGENGLSFEPGNWLQLAKALEAMLRSQQLREEMGNCAKSDFLPEFEIDNAVRPLAEAFYFNQEIA